jgi:hypothetical protein
MKLHDMFPSRYVKGEELGGRSVTVTISKVQPEKMRPNPQSPEVLRYVLYTKEGKKGVVLSKTTATQIAQAVGSVETDEWIGRQITLYPEPMTVAGVKRVAIRAQGATNGRS